MSLLAHLGCPRQNPESPKTFVIVVAVVAVVVAAAAAACMCLPLPNTSSTTMINQFNAKMFVSNPWWLSMSW